MRGRLMHRSDASWDGQRRDRAIRFFAGGLLLAHGLAHVPLGLAVHEAAHGVALFVGTALFLLTAPAFVGSALGAWGVPGLRAVWAALGRTGVAASLLLLAMTKPTLGRLLPALLANALLLAIAGAYRTPARDVAKTTSN